MKVKLLVVATVAVVALGVGYMVGINKVDSSNKAELLKNKEYILDCEAYIHELQAQVARNDAIINVMEDGARISKL